jgi:hypothetical protein
MSNETTYWGILCRTCSEPVAFDIRPYHSSGLGIANLRPGAIQCAHSHNHIYFPRDFRFLSSAVAISDATMLGNREAYQSINPIHEQSYEAPGPSIANAVVNAVVSGLAAEVARERPARPSSLVPDPRLPDPRRETARMAAKSRWANWALKKML